MAKDRVLLTGSTGFLGGMVAAELLQRERWTDVLLLVRAADAAGARQRLVESLVRFDPDESHLDRIRDDQIICGGLGQLPSPGEDARLGDVTRVLNCAAITSFGKNPRTWSTNVDETLSFARKVATLPRLERFIHVSTAMICGTHPPLVVREDCYPARGVEHLVDYTESKSEAEFRLREEMAGLPFVVVRPSIIVGHTELGCRPSSSIFWAFRIADRLNAITSDVDGVIDVVPVDYAAKAVLHLLFLDRLQHATYHISAGVDYSSSFRQIGRSFARALGETRPDDYRQVSHADIAAMTDRFHDLFGPCNKRFLLRAARLYGAFASLNVSFDNTRLLGENMDPPPRFADYLNVCVQTSKDMPVGEQMLIDFE